MKTDVYFRVMDKEKIWFRKMTISHESAINTDLRRLVDWDNKYKVDQITKEEYINRSLPTEKMKDINGEEYYQFKLC